MAKDNLDSELLYKDVGLRVKAARKAVGMTQDVLSQHIGLMRPSVTNIENGNQRIQLHTLYAIAKVLDCPVSTLLSDDFQPVGLKKRRLEKQIITKRQDIVLLKEALGENVLELESLEIDKESTNERSE